MAQTLSFTQAAHRLGLRQPTATPWTGRSEHSLPHVPPRPGPDCRRSRSDQRWMLARIKTPIGRRFHESMTLSGISQRLRRHGWSHQVPARRALGRDEAAVAGWMKDVFHSSVDLQLPIRPAQSTRQSPGAQGLDRVR
ncbi:winged helix-turn-helix domain-containing protein [Streptomyces sioyaensis]|uniref:winged helix-turn-helix domain-containing protein n=1 Tax=Streptomyces sioyaensis TaxID=67364 RepID=UPI0037CEEDFE